MNVRAEYTPLSPDDELDPGKCRQVCHRYIDGELYALTGTTDVHATTGVNLTALVRPPARERGCRLYAFGMKVCIEPVNSFTSPDMMTTSGEQDRSPTPYKSGLSVIIERHSPSAEAFDRGLKFEQHRLIDSLCENVAVSQVQVNGEYFRWTDAGWIVGGTSGASGLMPASLS